jgi:tricorn protease
MNGNRSLHDLVGGRRPAPRVTDELFNEYAPVWDPEGEYLFFLSERDYAPQISQIEWNFAGNRMTGVFASPCARTVTRSRPRATR